MSRPKRRRGTITAIVVIAVVLVLAGTELAARLIVSAVAADRVEQSLPERLSADVSAAPTGVCVSCELLGGGLSGLTLHSDDVRFGEITGDADIAARDVRLGDPVTAAEVTGRLGISEAELNNLLGRIAADAGLEIHAVQLRDDGIAYETSVDVLGTTVDLAVVANLEPRSGGRVRIVATSLEASAGAAKSNLNLDPSRFSFQACLAQYLPAEVQLVRVEPSSERLDVYFRSTRPLEFTDSAFHENGSCR